MPLNATTSSSNELTCWSNSQPCVRCPCSRCREEQAPQSHPGGTWAQNTPRWAASSTVKVDWSFLCLFHTWLCMTKPANVYTSKSHKGVFVAKVLLHGLSLLSFCSSGLSCFLNKSQRRGMRMEIAYIWKYLMNMLNLIRLLQPNIAGNVRTDRLCILKSQIIVGFSMRKGVQNYYPCNHCCFLRIFKSAVLNYELLQSAFQHLEARQIYIKEQRPRQSIRVFFSSRW